jgi:hypothetical protein
MDSFPAESARHFSLQQTSRESQEFDGYLLGRLPSLLIKDLAFIFASLPADIIDYKQNGFQSRFRAFSSFRFKDGCFAPDRELLCHFNRKKQFHVQGVGSHPEWLATTANLETLQSLLKRIALASPLKSESDYHYGINAVRVVADDHYMGAPAPGLHQDGYDFSCHINIARENVSGGMSIIAKTEDPKTTMVKHDLHPGEFLFFNDRTLHHTATAVTPMYVGHPTWRDMIIVDIVRAEAQAA